MNGARFWKRLRDSRWFWDFIQGPVYNRVMPSVADEAYEYIVDRIRPPENAHILDVGSGPGVAAIRLARKYPGVSVVGVDYSATEVKAAERFREESGAKNCSFRRGDAMRLPFEDRSFDVVMSFASLKHWPDPVGGLKEIRRVLVPEGCAFVGEADRGASEEAIARFAAEPTPWYVWDRFVGWYFRSVVVGQSYTREEAARMAKAAGFGLVEAEEVPGWPFFLMELRRVGRNDLARRTPS